MGRVGPARAPALPGWDPRSPVGSAGVTCLISTVDGSGLTPEIRECGQRHGPRASLPASKASLQNFPKGMGRDWRVPVGSVWLTGPGGHWRFAGAETVMVGGHPCPHQRHQCSTSRERWAVVGVFQSIRSV